MKSQKIQTGKWEKIANESVIQKTIASLKGNGIDAYLVKNSSEARKKFLSFFLRVQRLWI